MQHSANWSYTKSSILFIFSFFVNVHVSFIRSKYTFTSTLCTNWPGKKCLDSCISNSGTEPDWKKVRILFIYLFFAHDELGGNKCFINHFLLWDETFWLCHRILIEKYAIMCRKMTISLTPTPNFAQFLFELLTLNGTKCIEGTIDE
jgi:hypothetical protein